MWLLIDDVRTGENFDVVVRTPEIAKRVVRTYYTQLECICFDHDLGTDVSGYDIMVWALENSYMPKRVELITSNPVGRANMRAALEAYGYVAELNGLVFEK